ncbi:MAG: LacI family DNA-binding transcriptional regulator [Planctomycetes bacterium]|nr:LacI family DNA-binding transcriptional regulator [Planctomycetota bacterium]
MKIRPKIRLKDIARRAGVSPSLVSLILNGKGRASERVRGRVVSQLEQAGFKPKHLRKPFVFLLDLPEITSAGKSTAVLSQLEGIQSAMSEAQASLHVEFLTGNGPSDSSKLEQLSRICQANPGGVLVSTDLGCLKDACKLFSQAGVPVVQLGYDTEISGYSAVVVDSFSGAYEAVRLLISRGHKNIGTIRWQFSLAGINSNRKFAGFQAAINDAGLTLDKRCVKAIRQGQGQEGWLPARRLVSELLALPDPPTAVFVENSYISMSLLYPLPDDAGRLPGELGKIECVHFEDWPMDVAEDILAGKLFYPPRRTTFIAIDWQEIGRLAAIRLLEQAQSAKTAAKGAIRVCPLLQEIDGMARKTIPCRPQPETAAAKNGSA